MPEPIFYEHLIINGRKMSASLGNIVYPHEWLRIATPELLRLLFLKDPMRVRDFKWEDVPRMFDERDELEKIYYGKKRITNERDKVTLSRLFEVIQTKPLKKTYQSKTPFDLLLEIIKILPEKNQLNFTLNKLKELGRIKTVTPELKTDVEKRLFYAKNWFEKFGGKKEVKVEIANNEREAISNLIEMVETENDGEKLQNKIFQIAKSNEIKPSNFFKLIYQILLKSERGPRLGPYIIERGKKEVIEKLKEFV